MSDFDIFAEAGGKHKGIVFDHFTTVTDGVLTIAFTHRVDNPKISAIEVITIENPPDGYATKERDFLELRNSEDHKIKAWAVDALGNIEKETCEIELDVPSDWRCRDGLITGFTLMDASNSDTTVPVPGFEFFTGSRLLDLKELPLQMSLRVHVTDKADGVQFYWNESSTWDRQETTAPYSSNGSHDLRSFTVDNPDPKLSTIGTHKLLPVGRFRDTLQWESRNVEYPCFAELTIFDSRFMQDLEAPTTIGNLEQVVKGKCAPAYSRTETKGQVVFFEPLVEVQQVLVNDTVHFKTIQKVQNETMGWVTTTFVAKSGVEVCDKANNVSFASDTGFTYEAKCQDGFASATIWVYSESFAQEQGSDDDDDAVTSLPEACRNDFPGQVVKYTFVFSCDCENIPVVPPEVVQAEAEPPVCIGPTGGTWGDPHIVAFDETKAWGWSK